MATQSQAADICRAALDRYAAGAARDDVRKEDTMTETIHVGPFELRFLRDKQGMHGRLDLFRMLPPDEVRAIMLRRGLVSAG